MYDVSLLQFGMDRFNNVNKQVILGVKAGRGFGFLDKSFIIEASLNGHILETDVIQPANEVIIGAELLWEAGKKVLHRLRTGNVPLKLDCFTVLNGQKQERVGYILMTLRTAQTTESNNSVSNNQGSWHTILGVKTDVKSYSPALFLSLCIEEMNIANILHTSKIPADHGADCSVSACVQQSLLGKRITQLSSHIDTVNFFQLTVTLESAGFLQFLADQEHESDSGYNFSCAIMGHEKTIGTILKLSSSISNISNTDGKFEIKMCTSLHNLISYFQGRAFASIKLMSNGQEIAYGEINGSCFDQIDDLYSLCTHHSSRNTVSIKARCYLMKLSNHEIPGSSNGSKPYVDIVIVLQYLFVDSCQDVNKVNGNKCNTLRAHCMPVIFTIDNAQCFRDVNNANNVPQELQSNMHNWSTVKIVVESILLHQHPDVDMFYLRFHQEKATIVLRRHQKVIVKKKSQFISVQGVTCSLFFEGSKSDAQHEVTIHKPTVVLCTSLDTDCDPFAYGILDMSPPLQDQMTHTRTVELRSTSEETEYGVIKFHVVLENMLVYGKKCESLPFPGRNISPRHIETAADWKQNVEERNGYQKELFVGEVKQTEHKQLNAALEDWENHQKEYELAVKSNVQHCTELATSLNEAAYELRAKSHIVAQKEIELSRIEYTLQCEYQQKLKECREASRRMEDDFKLEISRLRLENKNLQRQATIREEENAQYLMEIGNLNALLDNTQKEALTEEQTTALLKQLKTMEEKYTLAYRSKMFFKDQWARVMREIHFMKSRHREEINSQIRSNKEELKHLGKMLPACEISGLRQLKSRTKQDSGAAYSNLQHHRKEFISNFDMDAIANSYYNSFLCKDVENNAIEKSTLEHTLQELVAERDSLLNTGSYSLDHVLITNLNKHIRQILTECNRKFV